MTEDSVVDLLISRGLIEDSQRADYITAALESEHDVTQAMEDLGVIQRDQLFHLVAQDIGGEFYDLSEFAPEPQVLRAVPAGTAKLYQVFPIQFLENGLQVAVANPLDPQNLEELGFSLNQQIVPAVAPPEQIAQLIDRFYYGGTGEAGEEGAPPGAGESDALAAIRAEVSALSEEDLEEESNS